MEARSKTIEQWFSMIEQGQIVLPRFQRHEAWRSAQIVGLLENVLRKPSLPVGALLVLEIGDSEPFHSRPIVGAPEPTGKPSMHLLDGQQRMTALFRSLTDDYEDLQLFVSFSATDEDEDSDTQPTPDRPLIEAVKRWDRKGVRQPVWADSATQTAERGLFPAKILQPGGQGEKAAEKWVAEASQGETSIPLARLYDFRQRVSGYPVPFLSLPVGTGKETALNVFIKMNTSASPLKDFDIVVAQLEEASGESLHDMLAELRELVPSIDDFNRVEDAVLSVAALVAGKPPLKKTYLEHSFGHTFSEVWPKVKTGFQRGIPFLREEGIFNDKTLPTEVVLYIVAALFANIEDSDFDHGGNALSLIRKAVWRASYTDRYLKTASTRAYTDYRALATALKSGTQPEDCELFDSDVNPLPSIDELVVAGWPGRKDRLGRAILATALRAGGLDFADGSKVSLTNLKSREYHHIFPVDVLDGDRSDRRVSCALNCALISWKTNRKVAASTPAEYIQKRAEAAHLGEEEVRHRLESHLIPYDTLMSGDYDAFLRERAKLIESHMIALCNGSAST